MNFFFHLDCVCIISSVLLFIVFINLCQRVAFVYVRLCIFLRDTIVRCRFQQMSKDDSNKYNLINTSVPT